MSRISIDVTVKLDIIVDFNTSLYLRHENIRIID